MDCAKVGALISKLRKEKKLTQLQLAEVIGVSDKAVSKWERGLGCPDVSLMSCLAAALGVDVERILCGCIEPNDIDGGNMKRVKFYVCPQCGNILTATGEASISCCGRKLEPLIAKPAQEGHVARVETVDDSLFITIEHEMTKTHFIAFAAYVTVDRVTLVRLYPEQDAQLRLPLMFGGKLYFYCSRHGLWEMRQ